MNERVVKPMSVARQELIDQLVGVINNCSMPLFVVGYVLQDVLDTVKSAAQEQSKLEKAQYAQQLLHMQTETSSNKDE